MVQQSGYSCDKIHRIKNYWLSKQPPALSKIDLKQAEYLSFDGTYFHKNGCLAIVMDYVHKKLLSYDCIERERYDTVYPILLYLKEQGLNPKAITVDGHKQIINVIKTIWPEVIIQRCLFHIQNQGLMWLRTHPKTQAGRDLRFLLYSLASIENEEQKNTFIKRYNQWLEEYECSMKQFSKNVVANKDLRRAKSLINNAMDDMFHFIKDQNIAKTTNQLEGFYSQLKHQYRNHRGLSETHKIAYLKWFCYFKSIKNSN